MNVLKLLEYIGEQEQKTRNSHVGNGFPYSQGAKEGKLTAYSNIRSKINELQLEEQVDTFVEDPNPFEPKPRMLESFRSYDADVFEGWASKLVEKGLDPKDIMSVHPPAWDGDTYKMYYWSSQT